MFSIKNIKNTIFGPPQAKIFWDLGRIRIPPHIRIPPLIESRFLIRGGFLTGIALMDQNIR